MATERSQKSLTPTPPSLALRLLSSWQLPLLTASILPALAATIGAIRVKILFFEIVEAGSGGVGAFCMGLLHANRPLVVSLAAASALLFLAAGVQLVRSAQQLKPLHLLVCTVMAALGSVPSLTLWAAESFSLSVVGDSFTGSLADASAHLSRLLTATIAMGLITPTLALALGFLLTRSVRRSPPTQGGRLQALAWVLIAVILGTLAGCFYVRSTKLHDAATAGSLQSVAEVGGTKEPR